MEKIRTGVIGTGFIGPTHIEALRRLGFVDVVALADIDDATAKAKAEQLSIDKSYGNYQQLLADPEIDVVHICSPNSFHFQMAKEALLAGKHVVCEKPLTMNSAQAKELIALAKEKGLANAVHFNIRFYPVIHEARAMIQNGELGKIFAVNGSYQQDWLFKETDYSWRLEPKFSGDSRAVADIGSHWLDSVEFMTGIKIDKVCADFATFYPTRKKPLKPVETYSGKVLTPDDYADVPINTEDYASVLLKFDNGAHGSMTVNQVAAGRKNRIWFEIYGSKKSIAINTERPNEMWIGERDEANHVLMKDPSLMHREAAQLVSYPGGHNEGFPDTIKQFATKFYNYIRAEGYKTGATPEFPTFEAGLRELQLCEAIVESAKQEKWLSL
ncbi:Gfo/Idh/MocA family protein [Christensenella timonensis]|uniref:Gfo/Idh/MocA family protein n=1 Tax=Christensenella timonensis TaxID=1816678 RepID=UPI00083321BC|nr:Gfo/Idh/MocA family oxidoreductase [Christensenella timonensis]